MVCFRSLNALSLFLAAVRALDVMNTSMSVKLYLNLNYVQFCFLMIINII